jgi:hypothetical protein
MRHLTSLVILSALLHSVAFAAAPASPPASQPAAASPLDPNRWAALLQNLGNSDFAQRDAAQKELDRTTWRDRDLLQQSAAAADDPEVKARLEARLQALNEDLAVNPPPISLNLQNASLQDTAAAFSKALGIELETWPAPSALRNTISFTLTATDQPFWDVFLALSAQHSLSFQPMGNQLRLSASNEPWVRATLSGPLAVFPQSITRERTASLQKPPGSELSPETLSFNCLVIADPRLRILRYAPPVFTEIRDDAGNNLIQPPQAVEVLNTPIQSSFRSFYQNVSVDLDLPPKKGTRITSAKGHFRFIAQTAEEHLDIADPQTKNGQSFTFADATLKLTRFEVGANGTINFNMSTAPSALPMVRGLAGQTKPTPYVQFVDAKGRIAYSMELRPGSGSGGGVGGGSFTPPYTLRFSLATKTKEFDIPFELKDLPLP